MKAAKFVASAHRPSARKRITPVRLLSPLLNGATTPDHKMSEKHVYYARNHAPASVSLSAKLNVAALNAALSFLPSPHIPVIIFPLSANERTIAAF